MGQNKCTTRKKYMVLNRNPNCAEDTEEYYYPLGQCMPRCGEGQMRINGECKEMNKQCRDGKVMNQCSLRCSRPEPMRIKRPSTKGNLKRIISDERRKAINGNARITRCRRLNRRGNGIEYVYSDGSCMKKCNDSEMQVGKRCRKKKIVN
jgi:hypothetical protein